MLALSSKLQSAIAGKSKRQEPETVGLTHSPAQRENACRHACAQVTFSVLTQLRIQIQETMSPIMGSSSHLS